MNNAHIISIGSLASFSRGLTYSGSDEVDYSSNVVLRSNNIDLATNTLNFDELKYISDAINIPEDKKLQRNSIFMCMSNGSKQHLGKVAFIDRDYPYAFGGFMGLIKPKEDIIIPKLLYYYFCSSKFKGFLSSIGNGANINNIKFVDIAKDHISVPDKTTQQSIIEELDKINELIHLKKEQLKDYDNLAQSIFYGMFGDPIINEKGWEMKKYGDEFEIGSGGTPSKAKPEYWENGNIPWIGSNMCQNTIINKTDGKYITEEGLSHSSAKLLDKGSVLVALVGATIGKTALLRIPTSTNQNIAFVKVPNNKEYNSYFVFYHMMALYDEFMNIGNGDFKMANLSFVRSLPIIKPSLEIQQSFSHRIELIEQQKIEIQSTIADLETLLASRMQYWFD